VDLASGPHIFLSIFDQDQKPQSGFKPDFILIFWRNEMPTDSLIVALAVCGVFLLFGAVVAWIDYSTTAWRRSQDAARPLAVASPDTKRAA